MAYINKLKIVVTENSDLDKFKEISPCNSIELSPRYILDLFDQRPLGSGVSDFDWLVHCLQWKTADIGVPKEEIEEIVSRYYPCVK